MSNADLLAQTPDYLHTLSLKCDPFSDDADGRFFYAGAALMQRLDLLVHLTQFGDSLVMVTGPNGSGKTTLLSRYATQAKAQWRLCAVNGDQFEQFPQLLADSLGNGETGQPADAVQHWASQTDSSQLLVFLVDRAEHLSETDLELLCGLLTGSAGDRVRLILFVQSDAQQALKQSLDKHPLPGSVQILEVPRLSEEETSSYLMYRLAVAGYSGESPFTATEIRGICKAAEGRPADINRLARETLKEQQVRTHSKRVTPPSTRHRLGVTVWGPATLGILLLAIYLGWERLQPDEVTPGPAVAENLEDSVPLALPAPEQAAIPPPPRDLQVPADLETPDRADPLSREVTPPSPVTETTDIAEGEPTATSELVETTTVAAPISTDIDVPTAPANSPAPPAATPAPDEQADITAGQAAAPAEVAPGPVTASESTEPLEPAPGDAETAGHTGAPHRETWLLQQDGSRYSLQLLGSRSEQSVIAYIDKHGLDPSQSAYYRGRHDGGEWYVLIYGLYADREAALQARPGLPAAIRKAKPWPRTLESVHRAIGEMR